MAAFNPNDDVDRLFACFKCGIATPESALKERQIRRDSAKKLRSEEKGKELACSSGRSEKDSAAKEKTGAPTTVAIRLRSRKQITPVFFYGSPGGVPIKKPRHILRLLREIHIDLNRQNDLAPRIYRKEVWATFPRQEEAMKFLTTHSEAKIFSYQDHLSGQRRFLVSTYDEFWRRYKDMDPKLRHHYEVIQEGLPCHLYFDLEFDKKVNSDKDVDEMVDILISVCFDILFEKYSIQGHQEWIVELDSSTRDKFSRHVIIRIPNIAFKDNIHAGAFVSEVCSHIASQRRNVPRFEKLYIRKDLSSPDSPGQLFLDNAVYSRNRCFRLAFSSKAGKNSFLLPTERFKCKNMSKQQIFMESLICRMDVDTEKLLLCKMDTDCMKTLSFDCEVQQQLTTVPCYSALKSGCESVGFSGKSPFPALDAFVEFIASNGNISGRIRSWFWFSSHGLMVYNMSRNRYCERIGREHKSNHVIYVADLQRGSYYQKCHDPDCTGYRSPSRPLPDHVVPNSSALWNSTLVGSYSEVLEIDCSLGINEEQKERYSSGDSGFISQGCKDSKWWQEASTYVDHIENMETAAKYCELKESTTQDYEDIEEDCEWWIDAEKIMSQVEGQLS